MDHNIPHLDQLDIQNHPYEFMLPLPTPYTPDFLDGYAFDKRMAIPDQLPYHELPPICCPDCVPGKRTLNSGHIYPSPEKKRMRLEDDTVRPEMHFDDHYQESRPLTPISPQSPFPVRYTTQVIEVFNSY